MADITSVTRVARNLIPIPFDTGNDEVNLVIDTDNTLWGKDKDGVLWPYTGAGGGNISAYNAATNTPNIETPAPGAVSKGDEFYVTVAGNFYTLPVSVGDLIISKVDDPSSLADYVVVPSVGDSQFIKGSVVNSGRQVNAVLPNTSSLQGSNSFGSNTQANAINSHSEGVDTIATGDNSHAEGRGCRSIGDNSHSEGDFTTSTGVASHAEGESTNSTGDNSHAEGQSTTSLGRASHSEGQSTAANGITSHSEGLSTTSNGEAAHSEGNNTQAIGDASHAEGLGTIANGNNGSHAEGQDTIADGIRSHVEGFQSKATANSAHAGGSQSKADIDGSMARSSGQFFKKGDSQEMSVTINGTTINAVTQTMFNGFGGELQIPVDSAWRFKIEVMAVQHAGIAGSVGDCASFEFTGVIKNIAATTSLVGLVVSGDNFADAAAAAWNMTVTADDATDVLHVTIQADADKTVLWTAKVTMVQTGVRNFA